MFKSAGTHIFGRDLMLALLVGICLQSKAQNVVTVSALVEQGTFMSANESAIADTAMLVRISEIEVYPEYLGEYLNFAINVGETSVREEPGVIAIYPMIQQRDSCQIRILEIYVDYEAYKNHITTAHFQTYKQGTLHMVKSLDLVDMRPMNPNAMKVIFRKMGE